MKNKEYWVKRQEAKYLAGEKSINEYYKSLEKAFTQAKKEIHNVVNEFYIRYANENNLSFAESQIRLSKAEIGELQDFIDMANEYMGEYNLELNNMSVKARITRYQALEKQIDAILQQLYSVEYDYKGQEMFKDIYTESYNRTWYNIDVYNGFHAEFAQINLRLVDELISYPFNGANYSDRLWKQKDHMLTRLKESLTTMMIQGKNPKVLAPEFATIFDTKKYEAYRLLHTEGSFIIEQATQKAYQEDEIDEYQFSATLDLKTSDICRSADGKVVEVGKGVPGDSKYPLPPMHHLCRSTTIPYLKDYKTSTRIARDEDGKTYTVPGDMTYKDWYSRYVKGNPKAELAEKKLKNSYADKKQYEKYKNDLGKDAPKSFDKFQDLKYTDSEEWNALKGNYRKINAYNKIVVNEPLITQDLQDISKVTATDMVGLEYRLKTKDSYLRKVNTDSNNSLETAIIDNTIANTNDVIRYTYQSQAEALVDKFNNVSKQLEDRGYSKIKVKNTWIQKSNPYKGVNCIFEHPNGQRFEMQFHTPESFELKNGIMHKIYEEYRLSDTTVERRIELESQMFKLTEELKAPKEISYIKNYVRRNE